VRLRSSRFLLALLMPVMPVHGWLAGNNYYTLVVGFVVIALLDFAFGEDRRNADAGEAEALQDSRLHTAILWACAAGDLALIAWGASVAGTLAPAQALGLMLSVGFVTGAQGITVAHELGHSRSEGERVFARVLLTAVAYGHFHIEHNRGHHVRVATPDDPASARAGESFYAFYPRAVARGWRHAWWLERERLQRRGVPFWSWRNQMLWFTAVPPLVMLGLGLAWGLAAAVFFAAQAWMAFTLLEAVNYMQHYGLARKPLPSGAYEKVLRAHAWNAAEAVSAVFLIHLARHSDHHENPWRRYPALQHYDDSPQMPTGYPGMLLLALVPPLWFSVMNRRLPAVPASVPT
jgi:alkane 1-monooxygenase